MDPEALGELPPAGAPGGGSRLLLVAEDVEEGPRGGGGAAARVLVGGEDGGQGYGGPRATDAVAAGLAVVADLEEIPEVRWPLEERELVGEGHSLTDLSSSFHRSFPELRSGSLSKNSPANIDGVPKSPAKAPIPAKIEVGSVRIGYSSGIGFLS
ncbi:arabinogalactan protein 1 [Iris pallida]|uniref:Arabinogalactan protein 1 n=1 Tax=Iris pallida TaxID=29817 RepID=A0AAX6DSM6_IRIPA|nr:arabinogalactan protein 1 [Iris pallida]